MGGKHSRSARRYEVSAKPGSIAGRQRGAGLNRSSRDDYYARRAGLRVSEATNPEEANLLPSPPKNKRALHVRDIDFHAQENAYDHITDKYELTEEREEHGKKLKAQLVVRRGKPFDITVKFERAYDREKDDLKLIFEIGPRPQLSRGTSVPIVLSDVDKPNCWGAKITEVQDRNVTIRVFTPAECIVGKWTLKLEFLLKGEKEDKPGETKKYRYTHPDPIYMLFNPWCPDDAVHLDDETLILEYVLNDTGKIYAGNYKQIGSKPWTFGQFEDFVLDCAFYLLDKGELPYKSRRNPVYITRKISALVNSCDDDGVLVGNWSGNYAGGTKPTAWVGSVAILEEFWKTKEPVKFGQCWVFSGVVTTLCRALGIPCRSVTNFASAHDVDASITIDMFWDEEGKPLDEMNADSIWNFHVWNDVWMSRPDLPSGYGGWQAIDATPQETSDGIYCAGPASVNAIRNGNCNLPFDTPFIFAEVNADKIHWVQKGMSGDYRKIIQRDVVGKRMSTRLPDGFARRAIVGSIRDDEERHDVTSQYKHLEGSSEERCAVLKALEVSVRDDLIEDMNNDISFNFVDKDDILIGSEFDVELKMANSSTEERNVNVTLTCTVVRYTGVPVMRVKSDKFAVKLEGNGSGNAVMKVTVDEYLPRLVDQAAMKISCSALVEETDQCHAEMDDFRLRRPDVVVEVKAPEIGSFKVGTPFDITVSFTNPLDKPLTKCEWLLEGPGLQKPARHKLSDIPANGTTQATFNMTPKRIGKRQIAVSLDTEELPDITGSAIIDVKPASQ